MTSQEFNNPTQSQIINNLRVANDVAKQSIKDGHHPFGAILVAPDNETILLAQQNVNTVNHAESVMARTASEKFTEEYLWECTLYTTVEPCVMCSGTQYWANIGKLVFGITEQQLLRFTGAHSENPTMDLPCRKVFEAGQKLIQVWGPIEAVADEIAQLHVDYWSI